MDRLELTIPVAMPTWNRILNMQHFERQRLVDLLHLFTFISITHGSDLPIWTVFQSKRFSMDLLLLEYLQTIRPSKSRRSRIRSLKGTTSTRKSRFLRPRNKARAKQIASVPKPKPSREKPPW